MKRNKEILSKSVRCRLLLLVKSHFQQANHQRKIEKQMISEGARFGNETALHT